MRYKILLAGKNQTIIDDFFYTLSEDFECQTTSLRSEDIISHVNYFQPIAFVYCITEEIRENLMKLISALRQVGKQKLKLILIGDSEDCYEFMRLEPDMVSLTLFKPITASGIKVQLTKFLMEEQRVIEAQKAYQEKMAEEQRLRDENDRQKQEEKVIEERIRKMQVERELREREKQEKKAKKEKEAANNNGTKHILVIDDDTRMLRLIKEELRDKYNVATAVSGRIALNFLERKKTDLILLDYEMPEENGPEVLEKLRANEATRDIPVVFLTGINDREKIQKVLAMKPQGYLLKPIECTKLIQTIRQVIG